MERNEVARCLELCSRVADISDCVNGKCPLREDWFRNGCERKLMKMAADVMAWEREYDEDGGR